MRKAVIFGVLCIVVLAVAATAGLVSVDLPKIGPNADPPKLASASAAQPYIDQGKAYLVAHNIIAARNSFAQAYNADNTNQEANLLYGITRVLAVAEDSSTTPTDGINTVRQIFENSGFNFTQYSIYGSTYTTPHQFAAGTPWTGAVIDFLNTNLLAQVNNAISNLNLVTDTSFSSVIDTSAINKGTGAAITIDYADVMVIKSLLQLLKCNLNLLMVYDLNVSLPNIQAGKDQLNTYRQFFVNDANLLKPTHPLLLDTAKTALIAFIDNYTTATQYLKNRPTQAHHLFVVDVPVTDEAASLTTLGLDRIKDKLVDLKAGLNGGTYQLPIKKMNQRDRFVDLTKFFNGSAAIDFRTQLANCTTGTVLADPKLGGLFPLGLSAAYSPGLPSLAADILGVACSSRGTAMLDLNPIGMYLDYSYSPSGTLTISNKGTANLTVSLSTVGPDSSQFTISPGTCPTLSPGQSCTQTVSLKTPYTIMNPSAEIKVTSNDLSAPTSYVNLWGWTSGSTYSTPLTGTPSATIKITGSGSVEFSGHSPDYNNWYDGSCPGPGTCTGNVIEGTSIDLYPQPSPGYYFTGWSGCDSVDGDTCKVTFYAAKTATATFTKDSRTPVVMGYPPTGTYYSPQTVTLEANKDAAIYYTLNGAQPSASSTSYNGTFSISSPTTTLKYVAIDPFNISSAVKTETYTWLANPTLTVIPGGSGGGTINNIYPYSGIIICSKPAENGDICSATLPYESEITLYATTDPTSLFSGWSIGTCPGTGPCKVTVDETKNVTGTFVTMPPISVETSGYVTTYHSTFQDALAHAHANSAIRLQAGLIYDINPSYSLPFSITLLGGYNAGFITQADYSYLQGIFTINSGSASIDRLVVK
jgi:hypothetical protein